VPVFFRHVPSHAAAVADARRWMRGVLDSAAENTPAATWARPAPPFSRPENVGCLAWPGPGVTKCAQPVIEPRDFHPNDESQRILAAILDASDDAIIAIDLAGVVFAWNRGAERIYGYSAPEMIGQPLGRIIPVDRQDEHAATVRQITMGSRVEPHDTVHTTRNGHRIDVLMTVSPILDGGGRAVGGSAMVRDTTAQRRAERALRSSEARGRAIIETAVDAIILIDRRGRIESFNPAAERLFQYRADEVVSRNISMLMPEPYTSEHDHYLRRYLMTGKRHIIGVGREVTARRKDGSTFPAHLSVAELSIEGEVKFTGIVRDLTERVKLEMKLREESGLVRIGELAAVLAHEVKNPLAAVSGAIQILAEKLTEADDREIVDEILRRLDGLTVMVGDLLLYARPPKPRFARVDLSELVENLLGFLQLDPAWREVESRIEGTASPVMADSELLKVALQNLLINALQAMAAGGRLVVRLGESADTAWIDVADSGPGIPADVQAKLFTPFFTTKSRGTGLGLATVKRVAEAHQGDVRVLSSDTRGTTMRFIVPVQRPDANGVA
jgi:two-component system, LuxR family, sensor kinase FixL